jgi:hypothetical protein
MIVLWPTCFDVNTAYSVNGNGSGMSGSDVTHETRIAAMRAVSSRERTVSNNDNLIFWPLVQPLASFLSSPCNRLVIDSPFRGSLVVPAWLDKGEIDGFAGKLVVELDRMRASVAREGGRLLELREGNDSQSFRLDVVVEAEEGGVERPSYGRRDDQFDVSMVRKVLLQLGALLLAFRREERVGEFGVLGGYIVEALCVADQVDLRCHFEARMR